MKPELQLYTRKDCCLCEEMKRVLDEVATRIPFVLEEIDVDSSAELRQKYSDEVPVLLIDGRKAFKYRLTARELQQRLKARSAAG
ncbi:MAG: glutaredoxin family protein [Candidatus Binatia bacterium]|jgi:glutaredoxin